MWMICARGVSQDRIDTNNLIEAFHHKLKYVFMRGHPGCRLDSEIYLLVEIVLRDMNFSVLINELRIGRMNSQQRQQRIQEIVGTKHINKNDIYKIQSDTWLIHSMTNNDIESLFAKRILWIIIRKLRINNTKENEHVNTDKNIRSIEIVNLSDNDNNKENKNASIEMYNRNIEIVKLQEDLATIVNEWKERKGQYIRSLREAFQQTAQIERARITRIEAVPQVDKPRISQIAPNAKFKKQNNF
ncbi:hypothetical protein F8M41_004590 [Gigaspora margarita]|uniref:Uncharacterized protein n=1 Tax=Gigaspora margarita TaxID=4874 RepID=A0A8H4AXL7_GIGMA|nr:hypothetical protein F8M41_004590 [Gigaspora margarita]